MTPVHGEVTQQRRKLSPFESVQAQQCSVVPSSKCMLGCLQNYVVLYFLNKIVCYRDISESGTCRKVLGLYHKGVVMLLTFD